MDELFIMWWYVSCSGAWVMVHWGCSKEFCKGSTQVREKGVLGPLVSNGSADGRYPLYRHPLSLHRF